MDFIHKILREAHESDKYTLKEGLQVSAAWAQHGFVFLMVNGTEYGYIPLNPFSANDIARKFNTLVKYSAGKALAWFKRNTYLCLKNGQEVKKKQLTEGLLKEHIVNALPTDIGTKHKYADEVYALLQQAYKGKLTGNGFQDKETMIRQIPFWKMVVKNGKVIAVFMYKTKDGRKAVAGGTDGSPEGLAAYKALAKEEFSQKRSYIEISGKPLAVQVRMFPDLEKYAIPLSKVERILKDDVITPVDENNEYAQKYPQLKDFFYTRDIGGEQITKIMVGHYNGNTNVDGVQKIAA